MFNTIRVKFVFADGCTMVSNMMPEATHPKNLEDLRKQYNAIGVGVIK